MRDNTGSDEAREVNPGVGMPAMLKLEAFGEVLREAFPEGMPYHVGSSLYGKAWRDVDVRLLLPDEDFARIIGPLTKPRYLNPRWNAFCVAFAALGAQMTGLPIDFQIDQQSAANDEFKGHARSALGVVTRGIVGCIDHATGERVEAWT